MTGVISRHGVLSGKKKGAFLLAWPPEPLAPAKNDMTAHGKAAVDDYCDRDVVGETPFSLFRSISHGPEQRIPRGPPISLTLAPLFVDPDSRRAFEHRFAANPTVVVTADELEPPVGDAGHRVPVAREAPLALVPLQFVIAPVTLRNARQSAG